MCSDDSLCTDGDVCQDAVCVGEPKFCENEKGECFVIACDPVSGCIFPPKSLGESCDDGEVCTQGDHCDGEGSCVNTGPLNCADAHDCTIDVCADDNPCTIDTCSLSTGCANEPDLASCNDDDPCTTDSCGASGCVNLAIPDCVLDWRCPDGTTPLSTLSVDLVNPGAETDLQGWSSEGGPFVVLSNAEKECNALPNAAEGTQFWGIGEVCPGPGTSVTTTASLTVPVDSDLATIIGTESAILRVTGQAGSLNGGSIVSLSIELLGFGDTVLFTSQQPAVTNGSPSSSWQPLDVWEGLPFNVENIKIKVKVEGPNQPMGGFFDDITATAYECP